MDLTEGIDLSIYLFGQFERDVARAYQQILESGSIVLDIGANIGAHALPMAKLCGKQGAVHAFEPTVYAVNKLKENFNLNPDLQTSLSIHHALLNADGLAFKSASIPSSWQLNDVNGEEKHPQHGGSYKSIGAATPMTVDDFMEANRLDHLDLIKLDVDGNEWPVLQGAVATINRFAPPILMEFALDYNSDAFERILALLRDANYAAITLAKRQPLPLNLDFLRAVIPKDGSINVLLRQQ
ncbi:MAG: FkbM family methyltransferase [Verrucomicrobia bacterium]|nr:FkbM family methyltransferase [Verrucomicrobiota bacterium]